jgi:osmotically-inducible protein OsmY
MSDDDLVRDVGDELAWEPTVDSGAIAVTAEDGAVTLRGTVGSFRQRREAKRAAERVFGVKSVHDELQVRILDRDRREDADVRGAVLQALMLDSIVPSAIDAKVKEGEVTLTGTAEWQYQRDEAEYVAANVFGVVAVENDIALKNPAPSLDDAESAITRALKRNAKIDADDLVVEASDGTVVLSGVVCSWGEHDEAVAAAWAAPGVLLVDDNILVEY